MKKLFFCLLFTALLAGCAGEETMETLGDVWDVPAMAVPRQILVDLPEDTAAGVLESDAGRIYIADDYEIMLETMESGDLDGTMRQLCGRGKDELTVLETRQDDLKRYEFVWATAGERGEQLGRAVVLDDGNYHYCLSVLRPENAEETSQVVWSQVFQSFALS